MPFSGLGLLFRTHTIATLVLMMPMINLFAGCFFLLFVLGYAAMCKRFWTVLFKSVFIGSAACLGWFYLFSFLVQPFSKSTNIFVAFEAPLIGLMIGYGILQAELARDRNMAVQKVNQALGLTS